MIRVLCQQKLGLLAGLVEFAFREGHEADSKLGLEVVLVGRGGLAELVVGVGEGAETDVGEAELVVGFGHPGALFEGVAQFDDGFVVFLFGDVGRAAFEQLGGVLGARRIDEQQHHDRQNRRNPMYFVH